MRNLKICILLFITTLFTVSCTKPEASSTIDSQFQYIIGNEGTFNFGNASIGTYNYQENKYSENQFLAANNRLLGDVLHMIYYHNNKVYAVVNNSGKIEVLNPSTLKSELTIENLGSPRRMLFLEDNKALVSNFLNEILLINLIDGTIEKRISIDGLASGLYANWTEDMVLADNKIYVTAVKANAVLVFNSQDLKPLDTLFCGNEPTDLITTDNQNLIVLCSGGLSEDTALASIEWYSLADDKKTKEIRFKDKNSVISNLIYDESTSLLYFLENGIKKTSAIATTSATIEDVFTNNLNLNIYSFHFNSTNRQLWVCDAKDFVNKGKILIFNEFGIKFNEFNVGVIPKTIIQID